MQNPISLNLALRQKSFSVAIKISVGLFLFLSLFLFYIQIVQKRNLVEEKIKIDSNLLVSSLKIGDLFFITKYVSSFVDSKSTPFLGIKDVNTDEWISSYPLRSEGLSMSNGFLLGLHQIHILIPIDLLNQGKVQWRLYYVLEIANRFLLNAFAISSVLCGLIFLFLRNTLTKTSTYFTAPISHIIADLENQNNIVRSKLSFGKYNEGQKFLETNQLVDALRSLIAEIENQQEEIKKGEVLKALNQLSRQVSHDIQSPIGALLVATTKIETNPNASKKLLINAIRRIEDIVKDLKIKDRIDLEAINVRELTNLTEFVNEIVSEKKAEFANRDIQIVFNCDRAEINREICRSQFSRAISNLINNGIEACEESIPKIRIDLSQLKEYVLVEITDNGKGIPEQFISKILEYGFTHGKFKGSGMGLSYADQIIRDHKGSLEISSRQGLGTVCKIRL